MIFYQQHEVVDIELNIIKTLGISSMKKIFLIFFFNIHLAYAATITVYMQATGGHKHLGQIVFVDSQNGLIIKPNLSFLPPGSHGFHIHSKPSCAEEGMAAGKHYDPKNTNSHLGPYGNGHLGDLPLICVNKFGDFSTPLLAPRLKVNDIKGMSVIIHKGGDTYSNIPTLGGGGEPIACGIIAK
jgi:superoxide dismutase, Cu-Zn family